MQRYAALWKGGLGSDTPNWLDRHGWSATIHDRGTVAAAYGRHAPSQASEAWSPRNERLVLDRRACESGPELSGQDRAVLLWILCFESHLATLADLRKHRLVLRI
jgi:hypothetical protein